MLNRVLLIGYLGRDPEDRIGNDPLTFSLATSEKWKDRETGERRERTEWHRVVIFEPGLIDIAEKYLSKGSKVYLEGRVATRSFEGQDGRKRTVTEIVLQGPKAKIVLLDSRSGERAPGPRSDDDYGADSHLDAVYA